MRITIIKKKASSLKELGKESIEINDVKTLRDLLIQVTQFEYIKQHHSKMHILTKQEIHDLSQLGKISFGELYNSDKEQFDRAIQVMLQDYKDGLFRVFLNQKECLDLDEELSLEQDNEIVFIRLVMMAGRLW